MMGGVTGIRIGISIMREVLGLIKGPIYSILVRLSILLLTVDEGYKKEVFLTTFYE